MSIAILGILALVVLAIVCVLRVVVRKKSKLRDSYAYDRVNEEMLLSGDDEEYDEEVLHDAFLSYKELKSKFKDEPEEEDEGEDPSKDAAHVV